MRALLRDLEAVVVGALIALGYLSLFAWGAAQVLSWWLDLFS